MRFISTRDHGYLDYFVGLLLIASPWLLDFNNGSMAHWIPVILGIMVVLMSLVTDFEAGLIKRIPMPIHLTADVLAGIFLAASPWLFGFAAEVNLPHLVFGMFMSSSGLFTEKRPDTLSENFRSVH